MTRLYRLGVPKARRSAVAIELRRLAAIRPGHGTGARLDWRVAD